MRLDWHQNLSGTSVYGDLYNDQMIFLKVVKSYEIYQTLGPDLKVLLKEGLELVTS